MISLIEHSTFRDAASLPRFLEPSYMKPNANSGFLQCFVEQSDTKRHSNAEVVRYIGPERVMVSCPVGAQIMFQS